MKDVLRGCVAFGGVWLIFKAGKIKGKAEFAEYIAREYAKQRAKEEKK